jgi:hypothetical protein
MSEDDLRARVDRLLDLMSRYFGATGERREVLYHELKESIRLLKGYVPRSYASYVEPIPPPPADSSGR